MDSPLYIYTFGGLKIQKGEEIITGLETRKVEALLVYLAATRRAQPRESLAELFWEERSQAQSLSNLRVALASLRKHLGEYLEVSRESAGLRTGFEVWFDAVELENRLALIGKGQALETSQAAGQLDQAVQLYRGEFLEGFYVRDCPGFEAWQVRERERLHQLVVNALHNLTTYFLGRGDFPAGIDQAGRLLILDPLLESGHRQMMQLLALSGKRSLALKQYEILRQALERELGVAPEVESQKLYEEIQAGRFPSQPIQVGPSQKTEIQPRHNLPPALTSFFGREKELAELSALLDAPGHRLVTLTGPGGIGKTRLALQAAEILLPAFPQGAWFVDLAPLTDPELVPYALAALWQLREQPWPLLRKTLSDYLRTKKLLLILDNCEHLVEACAQLCQAILLAGAEVKILATSRELLEVPGEMLYRVPGLSLPDTRFPPTSEGFSQSEAVQLFIDRTTAANPGFIVNHANVSVIAQICQQLDGIPLAIELAAARVRAFSIEQVAARLKDRFRLLTSGSRTSLPRHQTLRAMIDWSYNLLAEKERLLFQRLAVFSGGWSLEAAEVICSGEGIDLDDILDLIARLVDRSLVIAEEQAGQQRYRLLETLRQYALQALQESDQQAYWVGRHLEYYLTMAEETEPLLRSADDLMGVETLTREIDNLRAAFETAMQEEDTKTVLRLSAALCYFWQRSGRFLEGMNRMQQAIRMPNTKQHPLELANMLQHLGLLYWLNGEYQTAMETLDQSIDLAIMVGNPARYILGLALYKRAITHMRLLDFISAQEDAEKSQALFEEIHDVYGLALSNFALGRIYIEQGKFHIARPYLEGALQWSRTSGDRIAVSLVLNTQELLALLNGDYVTARSLNQEALILARQLNDVYMISAVLIEAGNLAQVLEDYLTAEDYFCESGEISRHQGLVNDYARTRFNLGYIAILQGDLKSGKAYLRESRELFNQLDNRRGQVECIDGFAALAAATSQLELAACLLGAGDAMFQMLGAKRWPVDQHEYDKLRTRLEENLGVEAFTFHYTSGQKLSFEQVSEVTAGV